MPKLKPETMHARKMQFLQAALSCFARTGYNLTTMDDIVQQAGLSKGSIYTYFESKKELFLTLLEKMIADTGLIAILSEEADTGREILDSAMRGMIEFTASPAFKEYTALLIDAWGQSQVDDDVKQTLAAIYHQLRSSFIELINQSIEKGEFINLEARSLANIFIAMFDGLMIQASLDQHEINWQTTAETIQSSWFSGLLTNNSSE